MNEPSNIKLYKEALSEQIKTFLGFIEDIRAPFGHFIHNEDKLNVDYQSFNNIHLTIQSTCHFCTP